MVIRLRDEADLIHRVLSIVSKHQRCRAFILGQLVVLEWLGLGLRVKIIIRLGYLVVVQFVLKIHLIIIHHLTVEAIILRQSIDLIAASLATDRVLVVLLALEIKTQVPAHHGAVDSGYLLAVIARIVLILLLDGLSNNVSLRNLEQLIHEVTFLLLIWHLDLRNMIQVTRPEDLVRRVAVILVRL